MPCTTQCDPPCTFSTNECPENRTCFLYLFLLSCASRNSRVHSWSSSKSAPTLRWFCHFDFQICFAPQGHATFDLSSDQTAALASLLFHTFSALRNHKTLGKHSVSRLLYLSPTLIFFLSLTLSLLGSSFY